MEIDVYRLEGCCGIREISGLSYCRDKKGLYSAKQAMREVFQQCYGQPPGCQDVKWRYAIFSEANPPDAEAPLNYGTKFCAYILENGLGTVIETGNNINPNSENLLKVWVWTMDHDAMRAWGKKSKVRLYMEKKVRTVVGAITNSAAYSPPHGYNDDSYGLYDFVPMEDISEDPGN